MENAHIMLEIEDYAFPFGLCFSRPIMLKIMLAYCINAYSIHRLSPWIVCFALGLHQRMTRIAGNVSIYKTSHNGWMENGMDPLFWLQVFQKGSAVETSWTPPHKEKILSCDLPVPGACAQGTTSTSSTLY